MKQHYIQNTEGKKNTQKLLYIPIVKRLFTLLVMLFLGIGIAYPSFGLANTTHSNPNTNVLPLQVFPLDKYDQNIDNFIKSSDPNYQKPLVDMAFQKKRLEEFYQHSFSSEKNGLSPWSQQFASTQLNSCPSIYTNQDELLKKYNNEGKAFNKLGYGVHFRPYDKAWITKIAENMNIEQFKGPIHYKTGNRAIFIQNTYARALPTQEPYYYHHSIPGEGYPFDQLQMSSIWAGTSAYIIGETQDRNWSFVLTPDFAAWVQSESLAKTNDRFITHWQRAAKNKLAAITQTETSISDLQNKYHHFTAYVGTVFPMLFEKNGQYQILFPAKDKIGNAQIKKAMVSKASAAPMPLVATPENFVKLIKTLQNRPYGWGGLYFLNDCSAELKSLYTPFGFWLARHSSEQIKAGKLVDKSHVKTEEKIAYLNEKGRPFMTFVYNTKHVFIHLGSFANPHAQDKATTPLTYQNLWALKPLDASRRAVVGKALLLPLLETFPEDKELNSHANHKDFQVIFLDEWPDHENHKP